MNYKLIFSIAKSLTLARLKQSMVAAAGVAFGITMFITMQSFMTGLNNLLDGLSLNRTPHVRLYHEVKPNIIQPVNEAEEYKQSYNFIRSLKSSNARLAIYNSGYIMESLQKDDRVLGFSPRLTAQAFFNNGVVDINGVINGIDVEKESKYFHFTDYVVEGNFADLKNISNSIILGKALAEKVQINIGDVVQITTVKGDRYPLKVVGGCK